ncbi:MAG: hypothetical protein Q9218_003103 [Villophora microphyllina]
MLSAFLTLGVVILHYISDAQRVHENPVDSRFLNTIRSKAWEAKSDMWSAAMEASVLMFSDIQATTGLAVLIGGYSQLSYGLSAYHWQVVIGLAWFSSLTHLATLTSLRGYFRRRPKIALYRITYMGVLLILLMVAFGTTGYVSQFGGSNDESSWPAECLFSPKSVMQVEHQVAEGDRRHFNTPLVVVSIIFLLSSFFARVINISDPTARFARRTFKDMPRRYLRACFVESERRAQSAHAQVQRSFHNTVAFSVAVTYIALKALYDIGGSMLWEITWLIAALAWGSLRLIGLRYEASLVPIKGENAWGFGQITPILLAVLPLCTIFTTLYEKRIERQETKGSIMIKAIKDEEGTINEEQDNQEDTIELLDMSSCAWFPKLINLVFGLALVLIGSFLYNFPAAPINNINIWNTDAMEDSKALGVIILQYLIMISICGIILD